MVKIPREADASPVAEAAKKSKLSEQTIYAWRKRFGTLQTGEGKRLKQLKQNRARLKRLLAEPF